MNATSKQASRDVLVRRVRRVLAATCKAAMKHHPSFFAATIMKPPTKTKPSSGRKQRRVKQRATVILEDTDDDRMTMRVEYKPDVSAQGPITSTAVRASLGVIKFLAENSKKK